MLTEKKELKSVVAKLEEVQKDVATVNDDVDLFFSGAAKKSVSGNNTKAIIYLRGYRRALELQEMLGCDVVTKTTEMRQMQGGHRVPLLWDVSLPTTIRKKTITIAGGVKATATIPIPPKEALDVMKNNMALFDGMQMWWVPSDIKFKVPPKPDPIIVGVLNGPEGPLFYDLYRWIDETVEDPYYSAIAY